MILSSKLCHGTGHRTGSRPQLASYQTGKNMTFDFNKPLKETSPPNDRCPASYFPALGPDSFIHECVLPPLEVTLDNFVGRFNFRAAGSVPGFSAT